VSLWGRLAMALRSAPTAAEMSDPAVKTPQLPHQRAEYLAHRDDDARCVFWEPGLGKTKHVLDVISHLFLRGRISQAIVAAPNSVYCNWTRREIPRHLAAPSVVLEYSRSSDFGAGLRVFDSDAVGRDSLRILAISFDALGTSRGAALVERLLRSRPSALVVDESADVKDSLTLRSRRVRALAPLAETRYALSGTPVTLSPRDVYAQTDFVDPDFWPSRGVTSATQFAKTYGDRRRLGRLLRVISPMCSRLTKEEADLDLPPKTYRTVRFALEAEQRRIYDELDADGRAELRDARLLVALGMARPVVVGAHALSRATRLHQVACGHVSAEDAAGSLERASASRPAAAAPWYRRPLAAARARLAALAALRARLAAGPPPAPRACADVVTPERNPRLAALEAVLAERPDEKVIVWCRFRRDVELIAERVSGCVRYDGGVSRAEREASVSRFCDPSDHDARVLVATTAALSTGLTLIVARTAVYYSQDYSLGRRLQSEDRIHRVGQTRSVEIVDLVAENTVDERIAECLSQKRDLAREFMERRVGWWS
jgi:SNF2 family DNA or RNA helicase